MAYIPEQTPPDANMAFGLWAWLKNVWQYIKGESNVSPSQITDFQLSSDTFYYPVNTLSGSVIANLPLSSTCLGKRFFNRWK